MENRHLHRKENVPSLWRGCNKVICVFFTSFVLVLWESFGWKQAARSFACPFWSHPEHFSLGTGPSCLTSCASLHCHTAFKSKQARSVCVLDVVLYRHPHNPMPADAVHIIKCCSVVLKVWVPTTTKKRISKREIRSSLFSFCLVSFAWAWRQRAFLSTSSQSLQCFLVMWCMLWSGRIKSCSLSLLLSHGLQRAENICLPLSSSATWQIYFIYFI